MQQEQTVPLPLSTDSKAVPDALVVDQPKSKANEEHVSDLEALADEPDTQHDAQSISTHTELAVEFDTDNDDDK